MTILSYEQGVAFTHAEAPQRLQWAAVGLHIFRRGGKHQWIPAVTVRQAERAKDQYQDYLALKKEFADNLVKERQHRLGILPHRSLNVSSRSHRAPVNKSA